MSGELDPDALAALEEQRDFLLASLRDLEAEWEAGDLDDADHVALRDDYTARAALVLRAIERHSAVRASARESRSWLRTIGWTVGVVAFAVLVGVVVAQASGRRGTGGLTGDVRLTTRERLIECQQALAEGALEEATDCFDEVIAEDPSNAEALAYRGWSVAIGSFGEEAPDPAALDEALEWIERAIEADATYPDALAFRIIALSRAGRDGELAAAFEAFDAADPPGEMQQMVARLRDRTPAMACRDQIDLGELIVALRCFEDVLADDPTDAEALAYRGWTLALTGFGARDQDRDDLAAELWGDALALQDEALASEPDFVDALAFRAIVLDAMGRTEEADEALVALFAADPPDVLIDGVESYIPDAQSRTR